MEVYLLGGGQLSVTHKTRARLEELRSRLRFKTWDDMMIMLLEVY